MPDLQPQDPRKMQIGECLELASRLQRLSSEIGSVIGTLVDQARSRGKITKSELDAFADELRLETCRRVCDVSEAPCRDRDIFGQLDSKRLQESILALWAHPPLRPRRCPRVAHKVVKVDGTG